MFRAAFQAFKNADPAVGYDELEAVRLSSKYDQSRFRCFRVFVKVAVQLSDRGSELSGDLSWKTGGCRSLLNCQTEAVQIASLDGRVRPVLRKPMRRVLGQTHCELPPKSAR